MNKTQQKQEAIVRMKMLKLFPKAIEEFEKEGIVNRSENFGILFWLNDDQRNMVKAFEEKHNAVVYHVIHSFAEFGELYSLLYVSAYEEEWEYERDELSSGIVLAYVKNKSCEDCSEFGSIGVKMQYGGLVRTM